jgi:hypothetical protein
MKDEGMLLPSHVLVRHISSYEVLRMDHLHSVSYQSPMPDTLPFPVKAWRTDVLSNVP